MNWIKQRLSRDNFWNIITAFAVVFAVFFNEYFLYEDFILPIGIWGLIPLISPVTLVPYILFRQNAVTYDTENKIFFNSKQENLSDRLPKYFVNVFILNWLIAGACIFRDFDDLSPTSIVAIAITLPVLYFIYLGCPISILFNKNAWRSDVTGFDFKANSRYHSSSGMSSLKSYSPSSSSTDYITSPSYSGLSSNIYNSNHRK